LDWWRAFDHSVASGIVAGVAVVLAVSAAVIQLLRRAGRLDAQHYREQWARWKSWLWLSLGMLAPILLGRAAVMAGVAILSLLCYGEFARVTGVFREKTISAVVVLGILTVTFASVDNYARLFFASAALTVGLLVIVTIPQDRPRGYLQRTALGVLGFLLFGYSFGYLSMMANHKEYRPVLLWLLVGVEINDVFAYWTGRMFGGPRLLANTSPGKTVAGGIAALVLTTMLLAGLGHLVFDDTGVNRWDVLFLLGAGISLLGQAGSFLLSSIKRDAGIRETGVMLPGHGGLLDRFESLVLVPPAVFHFLSLFLGPLNANGAERLFTGG
jgi:phosphatidate cytidylyltransferase